MKQLSEDMLRQMWQDSKKEAPEGFSHFIMENLPQQSPLSEALKRPLLSFKVAASLAGLLLALGYFMNQLTPGAQPTDNWYLNTLKALNTSLNWIGNEASLMTSLALLSVATVLLLGFDKLLQRFLHRTQ